MGEKKLTETKKDLADKFYAPPIAWLILVTSLLFTAYAYQLSTNYLQEKEEAKFKYTIERITEAVSERTRVYHQALSCGVAFMNSSTEVTREEWKSFVDTLDLSQNWPGIQALGYSISLHKNELQDHIQSIQNEGFKDFSVKPAGGRDFYTSILFLEPFDWRNKRAFGYDMWSNEMRRESMQRSRDTGKTSTSGLITLIQETGKDVQKGFLVYKPVYQKNSPLNNISERRAAFKGWVYAAFRTNDFMKGILSEINSPLENLTSLKIYDTAQQKENLMFSSNDYPEIDIIHDHRLTQKMAIDVTGRQWILSFVRHANLKSSIPSYITIAGVLFNIFIFYIICVLSKMKRISQKSADQLKHTNQDLIQSNEARLASEQRIKAIVENTADGIVTIDNEGKIQNFNKACERLLEYKKEEIIGKSFKTLIPQSLHTTYDSYIESFQSGEKVIKQEMKALKKSGSTFPIDLAISTFQDNQNRLFIGIIRDITEQQNAKLAQNILVEKLKGSNSDLERFAYIASHDLQEPLRMVTNFTQLLDCEYKEQLDENAKLYIKYSHDSALRMQKLVSGLLEYSRVTEVASKNEKVDLNESMSIARENLMELINDTNAKIKYDKLPHIDIENTQAIQLFQNLISNAIKYRKQDTDPEINIYFEDKADSWEMKFCDNGIGIAEKNLEVIFSPFKRLHSYNEIKGTGIGLSLCKKIIENIGGTISLHSVIGHGTIFTLTFPKNRKKQPTNQGTKNEEITN